jgi:hypothetical protein
MKLSVLLEDLPQENPENISNGKYSTIYKKYFKLLLNHEYESTCFITPLGEDGMATDGGETIRKHWKPFALRVWQTEYNYNLTLFFGPLYDYLDEDRFMIFDESYESISHHIHQMEDYLSLPKHCNHLWSYIDQTPEKLKQEATVNERGYYWVFSDGDTFGEFEYSPWGKP